MQGIDTTTPEGKLLFQNAWVFAEFERSMSAAVEAKVIAQRKQGRGMRAIARELQIGNCVVH